MRSERHREKVKLDFPVVLALHCFEAPRLARLMCEQGLGLGMETAGWELLFLELLVEVEGLERRLRKGCYPGTATKNRSTRNMQDTRCTPFQSAEM